MKRLVLIAISFLIGFSVYAQDLLSNFETESLAGLLEQKKGALLKRERYVSERQGGSIGGLGISITPAMLTDLRSGNKLAYILITTKIDGIDYSSILDFDEIPSCLESLRYIIQSEITKQPSSYVDVFFRTRDFLEIGAVYDQTVNEKGIHYGYRGAPRSVSDSTNGSIGMWKFVFCHNKYLRRPIDSFSIDGLQLFVDNLESAQTLLEEKLKSSE